MFTAISTACFICNGGLVGSVQEFTNRTAWMNVAGPHTTIDFTGFPNSTVITNQYARDGVLFTDGIDIVLYNPGFLNDGVGLNGAMDSITVEFSQPTNSIAVDFPGQLQIILYSGESLVYESSYFGLHQTGNFAGLISAVTFDSAVIWDIQTGVFIDDLHFGPPIPAPTVGALMALGLGLQRGRRRRRG